MKKKALMVTIFTAILVLVATSIPALARSEPSLTAETVPEPEPALGIRAPRVVPVGKETTSTVFDRQSMEPVEEAGVWLLSREQAAELRAEIAASRSDTGIDAADVNYESLISLYVESLGLTDENGQVFWTPEEAGNYMLVAIKDGYTPASAPIRASHITASSAGSLNGNDGNKWAGTLRSANRVRSENSPNSAKGMAIRTRLRPGQADVDTVLP